MARLGQAARQLWRVNSTVGWLRLRRVGLNKTRLFSALRSLAAHARWNVFRLIRIDEVLTLHRWRSPVQAREGFQALGGQRGCSMIMRHASLGLVLAAGLSTAAFAQASYGQKPAPKPTGYGQPAKPAGGYGGTTTPTGGYGGGATAPAGYGGGQPAGYGGGDTSADFPPNAHPGQCFARVLVPPDYEVKQERIVDVAEHTDVKVIPAVYGWDDKSVVVKEACTEYTTVPATYKTITETVTLRPASTRTVTIPAVYEDREEHILVREATSTWKRGVGLATITKAGYQTRVAPSGEIWCKVPVPAEYKTVVHKVLVKAEETREINVPAEVREVTRQVIDTPARVIEHKVPAVTKIVKVRTVVSPERTESVTIPATYREVEKKTLISGGKVDWREILCQTNTTRETIVRVQAALAAKGYYKGKATGVFGRDSMSALVAFQRDNNLPQGELTMDTVHKLNISL
jgi:hypothetical protein